MESAIRLGGFTGLNTRETDNAILDTELSAVSNLDLAPGGQLVKRTGFEEVHDGTTLLASSVHILGHFNTGAFQQFIAVANGTVYYSVDAITWTAMPGGPYANVQYGVQYIDKFYMVRSAGVILQWDGAAVTTIAGSPTGTFCKVFKDRLFVIDSGAAGVSASRIRFSEPFDFSATGWSALNYVGVGEGDGDWLVACESVGDTLILFKAGSMWQLYVQGSDTLGWILRSFNQKIGCISKYSLQTWEGLLIFVGQWGVYSTNGADVVRISSPVDPYFFLVTIQTSTLNSISAFVWKDKYVITLPAFADPPLWSEWNALTWNQLSGTLWAGGSTSATILVYNLKEKGWTKWDSTIAPHRFVSVSHSASMKGVYSGNRTADGKVYKYGDDIYVDAGEAYDASFETKDYDFGKPAELKRGKWFMIEVHGAGEYYMYSVSDGSQSLLTETRMTVTDDERIKIRGPGYFRRWKLHVEVLCENPVTFFEILLYLHSREHRQIKTGPAINRIR